MLSGLISSPTPFVYLTHLFIVCFEKNNNLLEESSIANSDFFKIKPTIVNLHTKPTVVIIVNNLFYHCTNFKS